MRLWYVIFTCLLMLSNIHTKPLHLLGAARTKRSHALQLHGKGQKMSQVTDSSGTQSIQALARKSQRTKISSMPDLHTGGFEDVMDFIQAAVSRRRRSAGKKRKTGVQGQQESKRMRGGRRRGGRGQGCVLKQIHLNVSELGLGFQSQEELIFSYCSGPCTNSLTNYDKILNSLVRDRSLLPDSPSPACCRPVAYDDDLSFLDDNLMYHTMRKHSARKCGCI